MESEADSVPGGGEATAEPSGVTVVYGSMIEGVIDSNGDVEERMEDDMDEAFDAYPSDQMIRSSARLRLRSDPGSVSTQSADRSAAVIQPVQ